MSLYTARFNVDGKTTTYVFNDEVISKEVLKDWDEQQTQHPNTTLSKVAEFVIHERTILKARRYGLRDIHELLTDAIITDINTSTLNF